MILRCLHEHDTAFVLTGETLLFRNAVYRCYNSTLGLGTEVFCQECGLQVILLIMRHGLLANTLYPTQVVVLDGSAVSKFWNEIKPASAC
jgi:hypothetical protein